jgi:hypothetical protein
MRIQRLLSWAVSAEGRREAHSPTADDAPNALPQAPREDVLLCLDHAGPAAARWQKERAFGAHFTVEPSTGRTAQALDDDGWRKVIRDHRHAADWCRQHGVHPVVGIFDDGLLHDCVTPLSGVPCPDRVHDVLAACAPCDVVVVIEDLAPGGLDPTAGVSLARDFAITAQSTTLYAACGTARLLPLHHRTKGTAIDDVGHFLASAAWCVGRVPLPIVAVGRSGASDLSLCERARRLGLAGVVRL